MRLGNREIENFSMPYIIAEIGANHNGDMELAKQLINAAKDCGCDAVKFQSWTPDSLIAQEEYDRNPSYDGSAPSLREAFERYYLRPEQHREMKEYCDSIGTTFCSSSFSREEADLLEELQVPFFKIASMDINNLELLHYVAGKQKPMMLSTGMATLAEIEQAIETIEGAGNTQIILLHCISIYPPAYEDIHLKNIFMLQQVFGYPVGFSDHSIGISIPLAAIALGSCVIEKHFTLKKDLPGWDHAVSANPHEMKTIVEESGHIVKALGSYRRVVGQAEQEKKPIFRRSAVAKRDLTQGHIITAEDLLFKRPGTGIRPDEAPYIIGRILKRNISRDELLSWEDLK